MMLLSSKNVPKMPQNGVFSPKTTQKVPFWSIFFSENYFFEIAQSKYIRVNIKNVISENIIFGQ
jgi:hypothetical protein